MKIRKKYYEERTKIYENAVVRDVVVVDTEFHFFESWGFLYYQNLKILLFRPLELKNIIKRI